MNRTDLFETPVENQWCPGCPNFGIQTALKRALTQIHLTPHDVCLVSGIGQAAKTPHYVRAHVFNGLHGRAIPAATGIAAANPRLTTLVTSGDGCIYGEGGNHLLHAFRRNPNITVLAHDNRIYALTKGQASPMTRRGEKTRLQFGGVEVEPAQMLATAIVNGCGFVARGFTRDLAGLTEIIVRAIQHRGLSLVDIIQPCITWGNRPVSWYRENAWPIPEDHDPSDRDRAIALALETPERFPIGILYEEPPRPVFGERYRTGAGDVPLHELGRLPRTVVDAKVQAFGIRPSVEERKEHS